ncbi:MAG: cbb3-type cytochrome c oxidase subunit 3 [Caulobacteraceae bacterium]
MTYEQASAFVQQFGSIYFFGLFLLAAAYALWPRKREEFKRAGRLPMTEEQHDDRPL